MSKRQLWALALVLFGASALVWNSTYAQSTTPGGGRQSGLGNSGIRMPGGPLPTDNRPLGFGQQLEGLTYTQQFGFPVASGQFVAALDPGSAGRDAHLTIGTEERGSTLEEQGFFLTGTLRSDDSGQLFLFTSPQDQSIIDSYVLLVFVPPQGATAPLDPDIRNWRTTRVDILYEARREAAQVAGSVSLPHLEIHANPPRGLVNLPSWFWATVSVGELDPAASRTIVRPWETTWEQAVTRCVDGVVPGSDPPVVDPCASHRTDWESRRVSGVDSATVSAQLVVTRANWWFGDGRFQPYRREGVGVASYDINNPPPVRHLYTRSSLQDVAEGGYEVQLDASWEARVTVSTSTGQSESFTIPSARTNVYSARHAVRESQAIVGQAR
jgi:hypothetical protein